MTGRVTFVGAGPGAADLITVRGLRALQAAEVILHDSLIDTSLLEGLDAELIFVGKRCGKPCVPQETTTELLAREALKGREVVRLKGGDPAILARLAEEALHLAELGIPFEIVPGVSSAAAAPAFAGIPLTHRGTADSFTVLTAHKKQEGEPFSIPHYNPQGTVVLLMALQTAPAWREQLLEQDYPSDLPVAFVASGATEHQKVLVTTVGRAVEDAARSDLTTPVLAVVGHVVALRESLRWFDAPEARGQDEGEAA